MFVRGLVLLIALLLVGCESNRGCGSRYGEPSDCERAEEAPTDQGDESSEGEPDEADSAADKSADAAADTGDADASADADATQLTPGGAPAEFAGYPCTVDCSGHEAGYQWAQDNGIDNPDDCGGNSQSFIEGCRAWAEEQTSSDEREPDEDEPSESEEESE